jgi:hypothetical protein
MVISRDQDIVRIERVKTEKNVINVKRRTESSKDKEKEKNAVQNQETLRLQPPKLPYHPKVVPQSAHFISKHALYQRYD